MAKDTRLVPFNAAGFSLDFAAKLRQVTAMRDDLIIDDDPSTADMDAVRAVLKAYNETKAGPYNLRPLSIFIRDDAGAVIGGLVGVSFWNWLYVDLLVVPEQARGTGLGSRLLAAAEDEARRRGCVGCRLGTMSFQAPEFYQKLGYKIVADYAFPDDHRSYWLMKRF